MIEDLAVPLMVIDEAETVDGKTRLQKLMCLACAELKPRGLSPTFTFQLYRFGPFSFDFATTLNQLIRQGFIEEDPKLFATDKVLYTYRLTKYGKTFLRQVEQNKMIDPRVKKSVARIVSQVGSLPLQELVQRAYEAFPSL